MTRSGRSIVVIALATLWVSVVGAQAPVHEHPASPDGTPAQGMMGTGHGGGIMTGVHELFVGHSQLTRSVTVLADGIRTVTESSDPNMVSLLKAHVTASNAQLATGTDPGLPMESDALRVIFAHHDQIRTTVEPTAAGISVTQTSTNPEAVAALQQHAAEVTVFVNEGMAAMRAAMMKKQGR